MATRAFPRVEIVEEGLRDGLQIEDAAISVDDRLRLLDALSATGLRRIVVGAFVSPRWNPQMADTAEVVRRMTPHPDVEYTALALNARGVDDRAAFVPPLTVRSEARTIVHACDVFVQRNTNRSQAQEKAAWPAVIDRAVSGGRTTATVAVNAAFGSNWTGPVTHDQRMGLLQEQWDLWTAAGATVDTVWAGDPMGWNTPTMVEDLAADIRSRWPDVHTLHLHLHDTRGSALVSCYAALCAWGAGRTLVLDSALGGIGGCPYCGNGRATGMAATEDLVDLLEEVGVPTGIDRRALIDAAVLLAQILRRPLRGKLSQSGTRPRGSGLYAMDMPFVETFGEARHFLEGPGAYDGQRSPWTTAITSPQRTAAESNGTA